MNLRVILAVYYNTINISMIWIRVTVLLAHLNLGGDLYLAFVQGSMEYPCIKFVSESDFSSQRP